MKTKDITAKLNKIASHFKPIDYWHGKYIRLNGGNMYLYEHGDEQPYIPLNKEFYDLDGKEVKNMIKIEIQKIEDEIRAVQLKMKSFINLKCIQIANFINNA